MLYDVIIVGGGPAGCAAAVYTARKRLKTLLITEEFGGQSIVSDDIQNWIGETHISGFDLAKKFEAHVRAFPDMVEIKMPERVVKVSPLVRQSSGEGGKDMDFVVTAESGAVYESKAIILTPGARRRKLGVPGEEQFNGKGVAYCSTCDAPLFSGRTVGVVGGGNAGLEAVVDLLPYAEKIYLFEYSDSLKGDQVTQDQIRQNPKVEILFNVQTLEIRGEQMVTAMKYKDRKSGEEKELAVQGIFVEIGSVPNSEMIKGVVELDAHGQVLIDSKHGTTSRPGIFAAGDITDDPYKQNNISAGDAVKAALAAYAYLLKRGS